MAGNLLLGKAEAYLRKLCLDIPNRRVGSKGNRMATEFFAERMEEFGFETETPWFDCIDWTQDGADLTVEGERFETRVSPYSLSCQVSAPLVVVSTVQDLAAAELSGKVPLLHGEIAKEQLMPKNFQFYNPDEHKEIIQLLETKEPAAIIAATGQNPEMAGGVYPFPLIEDGDFDIPSVYMKDYEGERLTKLEGKSVTLEIRAKRTPAKGCNVIARKGTNRTPRVVLCAHIDAKDGTPGAIDNATGVSVLLLLAELLGDYSGELGVEIVALNGEDYYAASGEMQYLELNASRFAEIALGINLDGVGYHRGNTAYSLYDPPEGMASLVRAVFARRKDMVEGEAWYQSDHSLFLMQGRPALALTSDRFSELWTQIAHTPRDRPEIVDAKKLVEAALTLRDLLLEMDQNQRRIKAS